MIALRDGLRGIGGAPGWPGAGIAATGNEANVSVERTSTFCGNTFTWLIRLRDGSVADRPMEPKPRESSKSLEFVNSRRVTSITGHFSFGAFGLACFFGYAQAVEGYHRQIF